jgi:hypothetical protein
LWCWGLNPGSQSCMSGTATTELHSSPFFPYFFWRGESFYFLSYPSLLFKFYTGSICITFVRKRSGGVAQ